MQFSVKIGRVASEEVILHLIKMFARVALCSRSLSGKSIGYEITGLCYQQIFYEAVQYKRYGHCKILPGSVWI